ncbi:hypothetical protein LO762_30410 [Actinocorallia sp. API 0066]|nr:hypothetical protein [Actinocorallia sp. API 0066]MCD0453464.1 hypothetical protein [Actinocorallia sp. API 0066]
MRVGSDGGTERRTGWDVQRCGAADSRSNASKPLSVPASTNRPPTSAQ